MYTTQKGDMLKYQHTLPKLPVPPLNQTLQRYLISVKPLMSNKEFQKTKDAVEEFGRENGVGQKLHEMLLEKAKHSDKWVSLAIVHQTATRLVSYGTHRNEQKRVIRDKMVLVFIHT